VQLGVAAKAAEDDTQLREAWGALPDPVARHLQCLQQQVRRSHDVIRVLVERCMEERDAKEAALRAAEDANRRLAGKVRAT